MSALIALTDSVAGETFREEAERLEERLFGAPVEKPVELAPP
jgi:hypothetical protein